MTARSRRRSNDAEPLLPIIVILPADANVPPDIISAIFSFDVRLLLLRDV